MALISSNPNHVHQTAIGGLSQPPHASVNQNVTVANASLNLPVVGDLVLDRLIDKLVFSSMATVGNSLVGRAGSTLLFPKVHYIGPAFDLRENVAMDTTAVTMEDISVQIKQVGKALSFTREQMVHDGGLVSMGIGQFATSIADKLDNDLRDVLRQAPLGGSLEPTKRSFANLVVAWGEDILEPTFLVINPQFYAEILSSDWIAHLRTESGSHLISGVKDQLMGINIIVSNRCSENEAFLVRNGALAVEYSQNVDVNTGYDELARRTNVVVDLSYVAFLADESRALRLTVGN